MKRIVVTGGAGFIGSHLVDKLLEDRQNQVIVVDNFFTGVKSNLARSLESNRLEIVRHDVVDPFRIECDEVYHLACPASPKHYQRNPVGTIETATLGTRNALECARRCNAAFLLASTSEVYGDPEVHPQPETYHGNVNTLGPRACYDEGKRAAESMTVAWNEQYGVEAGIARIFNTYGPRMTAGDGRLLPNLINQAIAGEPLMIYGDGRQTRSFCYVSDTVDGLVRLMEYTQQGHEDPVVVYNIGNQDERTISDVASDVDFVRLHLGLMPSKMSGFQHRALPVDDPRRRRPDTSKIEAELGWTPKVKFEEGLRRTFEWFLADRDQIPPTH